MLISKKILDFSNIRYPLVKFAVALSILSADFFSKSYFYRFKELYQLGPMQFKSYPNPGIFLGHLHDLAYEWRVVGISTTYGVLLFFFFLFMALINEKAQGMRWGLTLFFVGITGNVVDRLRYNFVIDFIRFQDFAYNLADVSLMLGIVLVVLNAFLEMNLIWYPDNNRKNFLVDQKFQIRMSLKLTALSLMGNFLLGLFSYKFLEFVLQQSNLSMNYLRAFLNVYFFLSLFFSTLVFLAGLYLGHRSAGAIFSFERYILKLLEGEAPQNFGLRKNDYHKNLEVLAHKLAVRIKQNYQVSANPNSQSSDDKK